MKKETPKEQMPLVQEIVPQKLHLPKTLLEPIIYEMLSLKKSCVLLTCLKNEDEENLQKGMRLLYTEENVFGSMGGGSLETKLLEKAKKCLTIHESALMEDAQELGRSGCSVLFEYLAPQQADLFHLATEAIVQETEGTWRIDYTDVHHPRRTLLLTEKPTELSTTMETLLSKKELSIADVEGAQKEDVNNKQIVLEPLEIPPVLSLIGVNSIAQETAKLAFQSGFLVDMICVQKESLLAKPACVRTLYQLPETHELLTRCPIGGNHYVVLLNETMEHDCAILAQLLTTHAAYIGMFGDKRRGREIFRKLRDQGVAAAELACVRSPVGLKIGARNCEEAAVAIVAELIAAKNAKLQQFRNANL